MSAARYKQQNPQYVHHSRIPSAILITHSMEQKLTGFQLVKKFPAFYGNRKFITAFKIAATCPYPQPD
jgi:hypothetical protein